MITQERLSAGVTEVDVLLRRTSPRWNKVKVRTVPDTSYSQSNVCFLLKFPDSDTSSFSLVRAENLIRWIDSLHRESTVTYALTWDDPQNVGITTILAELYHVSCTIRDGQKVFDETPLDSDGTPLPVVSPPPNDVTRSIRDLFLDYIFPHFYAGKGLVMSPAPRSLLEYRVVRCENGQKAYQLV